MRIIRETALAIAAAIEAHPAQELPLVRCPVRKPTTIQLTGIAERAAGYSGAPRGTGGPGVVGVRRQWG